MSSTNVSTSWQMNLTDKNFKFDFLKNLMPQDHSIATYKQYVSSHCYLHDDLSSS